MRTVRHTFALVCLLIAAFFVATGCNKYDELVTKDQTAQAKWGDLEAQLQRRADLVPNLVETVRGSAKHEQDTLTKVIEARAQATNVKLSAEDLSDPQKVAAFQEAQSKLTGALSRLLVVQEQYPDLKANAGFRDLQVQLEGTENRLLRAREQYNAAVSDYNATLAKIGGQLVNRATGRPFQPRVYFQAAADAHTVPKVSFGQ